MEAERPSRTIKLAYESKINDLCVISCINLLAIVQERNVEGLGFKNTTHHYNYSANTNSNANANTNTNAEKSEQNANSNTNTNNIGNKKIHKILLIFYLKFSICQLFIYFEILLMLLNR